MLKLLTALYVLFLATCVWLANTAQLGPLIARLHGIPLGDKTCHFLLFGTLSFLLSVTLSAGQPHRRLRIVGLTIVGLVALTTLEELSQGFFAHRHVERLDLLSNIAGTCVFGLGSLLLPLPRKTTALDPVRRVTGTSGS